MPKGPSLVAEKMISKVENKKRSLLSKAAIMAGTFVAQAAAFSVYEYYMHPDDDDPIGIVTGATTLATAFQIGTLPPALALFYVLK